jgi:hypothetical protein
MRRLGLQLSSAVFGCDEVDERAAVGRVQMPGHPREATEDG